MTEPPLRIGDLARETGVKVVTIRYYETIGLLPTPRRSDNRYRAYDRAALDRLRFIRRCRGLGFSLDQIRDLLELASETDRACDRVDSLTAHHLEAVERKIAKLQALAGELRRYTDLCPGERTISSCRIVEAMAGDQEPDATTGKPEEGPRPADP
ncbi:MAG: helix-turn-helix domain-containing protein [Rhodospirillales bacterium]